MKRAVVQIMVLTLLLTGCSEISTMTNEERSAVFDRGRYVYTNNCASCHGTDLTGTNIGPPLIWDLYISRHHSDRQFKKAILQGVKQHHWQYGDMPSFLLKDEEVSDAVYFIRQTLRENGIR